MFETSKTHCDKSTKSSKFFQHAHVNNAPIGSGNENYENDEKGRRKRKRRRGGKGKAKKENEKESSNDAPSAKDKAILAATEKLEQKERAYAEMAKRLDDAEALSTQATNDLSEEDKIIHTKKI